LAALKVKSRLADSCSGYGGPIIVADSGMAAERSSSKPGTINNNPARHIVCAAISAPESFIPSLRHSRPYQVQIHPQENPSTSPNPLTASPFNAGRNRRRTPPRASKAARYLATATRSRDRPCSQSAAQTGAAPRYNPTCDTGIRQVAHWNTTM